MVSAPLCAARDTASLRHALARRRRAFQSHGGVDVHGRCSKGSLMSLQPSPAWTTKAGPPIAVLDDSLQTTASPSVDACSMHAAVHSRRVAKRTRAVDGRGRTLCGQPVSPSTSSPAVTIHSQLTRACLPLLRTRYLHCARHRQLYPSRDGRAEATRRPSQPSDQADMGGGH